MNTSVLKEFWLRVINIFQIHSKLRLCLLGIVLFFPRSAWSQTTYQAGILPAINFNKKLERQLKLNFKSETRQQLLAAKEWKWQHELVDFSSILSKKVGLNSSLAIGYLIRFRNKQIIHRSIQQYIINQEFSSFRLSHRISTDQTFESEETTFRLRYRLANQIPLKGKTVNAKEFYLKINNEYLNSFKHREYDLEIRLTLMIGYEFTDCNKVEIGTDQRFSSFIDQETKVKGWMGINWYIAL